MCATREDRYQAQSSRTEKLTPASGISARWCVGGTLGWRLLTPVRAFRLQGPSSVTDSLRSRAGEDSLLWMEMRSVDLHVNQRSAMRIRSLRGQIVTTTHTCVNHYNGNYVPFDVTRCAYMADIITDGGDSGSPVFKWSSTSGNSALLVGTLFGSVGGGAVFSKFSRIASEMGGSMIVAYVDERPLGADQRTELPAGGDCRTVDGEPVRGHTAVHVHLDRGRPNDHEHVDSELHVPNHRRTDHQSDTGRRRGGDGNQDV